MNKDVSNTITLFSRSTSDVISDFSYPEASNVTVTKPINTGQLRFKGAELIVKHPITAFLKFSLSIGAAEKTISLFSGERYHKPSYSGNTIGEQVTPQGYSKPHYRTDAVWSHTIATRTYLNISAVDMLASQREVTIIDTSALKSIRTERPLDQCSRIAVTRKFGSGKP